MSSSDVSGDRALLEAAARVYWGDEIDDVVSIEWSDADDCIIYTHADNQDHEGRDVALLWNPRDFDGDALLLAVKCEFRVTIIGDGMCEVATADTRPFKPVFWHDADGDTAAATRHAITRAAAAIGASLPA